MRSGGLSSSQSLPELRAVGETDEVFVRELGVSVGEATRRLVTDEVLSETDARQIHRLLVAKDPKAISAVMRMEKAGGSSSRRAVREFQMSVIELFPPSKLPSRRRRQRVVLPVVESGVPVIESVCATLAARVAATSGPNVVLVGRGKYNPIHKMHLRHFAIARQFLEERTPFKVLGGLLVPKHATEVRQRCRQRPREIIPPRHRLAMARAAVGSSAWLTVDPWEITRRRILDYLPALARVRDLFTERFPDLDRMHLVFLVSPDELLRLNLDELKDAGHACITVCRPQEHARLRAQLGSRWTTIAHVVEDVGLLSAELERTTAAKLRRHLADHKGALTALCAAMLPNAVAAYIKRHHIARKMAGVERWSRWDKELVDGEKDRGYRRQPKKYAYESTTYIKT